MTTTIAQYFSLAALRRSASIGPIGLDIGTRRVKAVQLSRDADGAWLLRAAAVFPRSAGKAFDAAEAIRITDVLFRRGFVGRDLVLAVPGAKLLATNLELPPRSAEMPLDQIARCEFARSLKVENESIEFAYWDLPAPARAARATNVMGVGCRHSDCLPMIDGFESAGYELRAIEVEACALTRACFPVSAPPNEITAIVDIGHSAVRLFVIHQGVVSYQRALPGFGMDRLHKLLSEQFDTTDDEIIEEVLNRVTLSDGRASNEEAGRALRGHFDAVAAEVMTSLSYSAHQYPDAPVSRVLLCGGGAMLGGLEAHLSEKLGVESVAVKACDLVKMTDANAERSCDRSLPLAIGLAQMSDEIE